MFQFQASQQKIQIDAGGYVDENGWHLLYLSSFNQLTPCTKDALGFSHWLVYASFTYSLVMVTPNHTTVRNPYYRLGQFRICHVLIYLIPRTTLVMPLKDYVCTPGIAQ